MRHSVQVQTDNPGCDFNLLILDSAGQVLAADRGPEPGAECLVDTSGARSAVPVVFVVELVEGSGSFSLQVASGQVSPGQAAASPKAAAHNRWRSKYGVGPLTWSSELAEHAQEWADELEATGMQMRHRSPNDFGENLYWCSGRPATPDAVVDAWGNEDKLYDYDQNNWWPQAGHFSQLVWHSTTEVGAGVVRRGGQELWVCNYNPRGNWTGKRPYTR